MLVQCMQDQANPQVMPQNISTQLKQHLGEGKSKGLHCSFYQIRTLASRAAASFVLANESNTVLLKHFADLLPGILQVRCSPYFNLDVSEYN